MGHINRIDISQLDSAKALALALQGTGELRVSKRTNTEGTEAVFLRERTFVESVKDFLGIDAETRQRHADEALQLIEGFLDKHAPAGAGSTQKRQAILNIRTEANRQKSFTGSVVAEEMKHLLTSKNTVDPLKGGPVAASRKAESGINLMSVSPMRVEADNAVLRSSTLLTALQANPELANVADKVQSVISLVDMKRKSIGTQGGPHEQLTMTDLLLTTPSVMVLPDLKPNVGSEGELAIQPDQLKLKYEKALKGKTGTLVMEPFPDQFKRDKNGTWATFSDKGLKMMMHSIIDAVAEAAEEGKKLHVTIASTDENLIARLKSSYAVQQKKFVLEDESDSDSDDEELTVDPAVVAMALNKTSEEENSSDDDGTGVFPR